MTQFPIVEVKSNSEHLSRKPGGSPVILANLQGIRITPRIGVNSVAKPHKSEFGPG